MPPNLWIAYGLLVLVLISSWIYLSYFDSTPSVQPTSVTISILRLAHKYDVSFLKRRAAAHLNRLLPSKWDDTWKLLDTHDTMDFLPMLEVASVVEMPWVLPAVNFLLMTAPVGEILDQATWNSFSPSIQRKYIIARERCLSNLAFHSSWIWDPPTASCLSVGLCTSRLPIIQSTTRVWQILPILPEFFCEECVKAVHVQCHTSGEQFWDDLPKIIGLGSWEDLAAAKDSYGN